MTKLIVNAVLVAIPAALMLFASFIIFAVPSKVAGWKAQGLTEAPMPWQFSIDLADFLIHRWFVWLPLYILVAIGIRSQLNRQEA